MSDKDTVFLAVEISSTEFLQIFTVNCKGIVRQQQSIQYCLSCVTLHNMVTSVMSATQLF